MKQLEGFVEDGLEDHVCKLVHTIYGTMQGAHDWYETLKETYDKLGYITFRADPASGTNKKMANTPSQTLTLTTFLVHRQATRR